MVQFTVKHSLWYIFIYHRIATALLLFGMTIVHGLSYEKGWKHTLWCAYASAFLVSTMFDNVGCQPSSIWLWPILVGPILLSIQFAVFWRPYIRISHLDIIFIRFPCHSHKYYFLFDFFTYIVIFSALHTSDCARPDIEVDVINLACETLGIGTLVQIVAFVVFHDFYVSAEPIWLHKHISQGQLPDKLSPRIS